MSKDETMKIVDCAGPPRVRGQAHGEALRTEISEGLARWANATIKPGADEAEIDAYCERFVFGTGHLARAETQTPTLFEELLGIAEGAGQPLMRIAAYNLMDEQWWYDASFSKAPPGCSLVATAAKDGYLLAQNMDLPEHLDGGQVVLRLSGPDMPDTVLLSAAGLIGLTGANAAGLAVGVNTLLMLSHDAAGLPVAFALRHALSARTLQDAIAALEETAHASGQHYALVTKDNIVSMECSRAGCAEAKPPEDGPLLHTNHPLVSTDIDVQTQTQFEKAGFNGGSRTRLDWMQERAGDLRDASDVQAVFDDPTTPLCMRPHTHDGSATFATVLYEMTDQPTIRMRKGVAASTPWISIPFTETLSARAS